MAASPVQTAGGSSHSVTQVSRPSSFSEQHSSRALMLEQ